MTEARLHPRLLPSQARLRADEFASLSVDELRQRAGLQDPAAVVYAPVGATRITLPELRDLQSSVRAAADAHGYPEPPSAEAANAFDRALAVIYLEHGRLFPGEATSGDIWSFHALVLLPDVCYWRWRTASGAMNVERVIGTDLTRHALARMWWRAYLLSVDRTGTTNPRGLQRLSILGEADFDQIQSRRNAYGASPVIFQALVDLWKTAGDDGRLDQVSEARRAVLRNLLIRLLRLGAFVRFDLLESDDLRTALDEALDETLAGFNPAAEQAAADVSAPPAPDSPQDHDEVPDGLDHLRGQSFDDVPLKDFPLLFATVVDGDGPVRGRDLAALFESKLEIEVPPARERVLKRLAFVSAAFEYLQHDEDKDTWARGQTSAATDRRWGNWSVATMRERAVELSSNGASADLEGALLSEVFQSPRPSRLAKFLVNTVCQEAAERS